MAANINKTLVGTTFTQKAIAKSKMIPAVTEYSQIIATPALSRKCLPKCECVKSQRKTGTRKKILPPKRQSFGVAFSRPSPSIRRAIKVTSQKFIG
jgi:hypothetical protein